MISTMSPLAGFEEGGIDLPFLRVQDGTDEPDLGMDEFQGQRAQR